jgi:hypothetical protein
MHARALTAWFSLGGPSEWHDFDYLRPAAARRGMAATLLVIFAIAAADVCWARTTVAILYVVPLLLLAQSGQMRYLGRIVGLLVALTLSAYLVKKMMSPNGAATSYFHYSLLNRGLVVAMLIAIGWVLRIWVRWREEQSNPELPDEIRYQDREISATLAMALCAPLVAVIVLVDAFSPANFNLAILYPIPLLICIWTRSRALMWTMLAILLSLAAIAQWAGPPTTDPSPDAVSSLYRNRLLAGSAMVAVTAIVHFWIGRK